MAVRVHLPSQAVHTVDWAALREELQILESFSEGAMEQALAAAASPPQHDDYRTNLEFFTVDPPGSMDLDQAMFLEQLSSGYRVHYAIADVAAFVREGTDLDEDSHLRGETFYAPDTSVPLHPPVLSEGAASLLPNEERPAVVWTVDLDSNGELVSAKAERALVRSRRRLTYDEVQKAVDAAATDAQLDLLRTIGQKRQLLARNRGAIDLPTPEQLVTDTANGPQLSYRANLECEGWNEQISMVTGIAAARMMVTAGIGLVRTLPQPDPAVVESIRRSAVALGVEWPEGVGYGEVISKLDPHDPAHAALLTLATKLLRGAAYTVVEASSVPSTLEHSAVASVYAHCTAPLRRLADRYVNEVCVALSAGAQVPAWVKDALPGLVETMATADRKARALERAVVDAAEAVVLRTRIGEVFDAAVVEITKTGGVIQLVHPAVRAQCSDVDGQLGRRVRARLDCVDVAQRKVSFTAVT